VPARRTRCAHELLRQHAFDPADRTVPFCSSCSTAAHILLAQPCHGRAVCGKKPNPDKALRGSQERACGMARALQKWLRGTRRPVSFFFNHLTGDDSWTWQK
jgi:hypothetical protein